MPETVFAVTTRGLEEVSALEMRSRYMQVTDVHYRRVEARCDDLTQAAALRTVDDVFIQLQRWPQIPHVRTALEQLTAWSAALELEHALKAVQQVRKLNPALRFSVTANFVGKRNYTVPEIKAQISDGILQRHGHWHYCENDDEADLNFRVFIEHDEALVGLRLTRQPLHRRAYKEHHLPGSLKPTIASSMLLLAEAQAGMLMLDPFCGVGTLPIEAAWEGLVAMGGDLNPSAVREALENRQLAGLPANLCQWDGRRLPLATGSVDLTLSNLPWGRQVQVDDNLKLLYQQALDEIRRVTRPGGHVLLLTTLPDWLETPASQRTEISLYGQNPQIVHFMNE